MCRVRELGFAEFIRASRIRQAYGYTRRAGSFASDQNPPLSSPPQRRVEAGRPGGQPDPANIDRPCSRRTEAVNEAVSDTATISPRDSCFVGFELGIWSGARDSNPGPHGPECKFEGAPPSTVVHREFKIGPDCP